MTNAFVGMTFAPGVGPGGFGMPSSRHVPSARVARRHDVRHDPRPRLTCWSTFWFVGRCQSLAWTPAHAVVSPVQRYGIDVTRPRITDRPRRPWLGRMARVARPPSGDATVHFGKTASRATCGWQPGIPRSTALEEQSTRPLTLREGGDGLGCRGEATLPTPWAGRDE